jgi:hypothetical protein
MRLRNDPRSTANLTDKAGRKDVRPFTLDEVFSCFAVPVRHDLAIRSALAAATDAPGTLKGELHELLRESSKEGV